MFHLGRNSLVQAPPTPATGDFPLAPTPLRSYRSNHNKKRRNSAIAVLFNLIEFIYDVPESVELKSFIMNTAPLVKQFEVTRHSAGVGKANTGSILTTLASDEQALA